MFDLRNRVGKFLLCAPGFLLLLAPGAATADPADPEIAAAEKTLKDAGIGTRTEDLLKVFRERMIPEVERAKLSAVVRQLGDDDFTVRQAAAARLVRAGRVVLPLLRQALDDPDPEVASRARACLQRIEKGSDAALLMAAGRLLAERKAEGAAQTLLDYLPLAEDDFVRTSLFGSLASLRVKDHKADELIRAAARDKQAARRGAAAYVLSRAGAEQRKLAQELLKDSDPGVRFEAAMGLVRAGSRDVVPELVHLLSEAPAPLAYQAEDLLFGLAGDKPPSVTLGKASDDDRKTSREAWEKWWTAHGAQVDLTKVEFEKVQKGLTLIVEHDGAGVDGMGRVWECDRAGKVRWQLDKDMGGPIDACVLPNGRVLVAEYKGHRVSERDREGKILWAHDTGNSAVSCQRLANGNTLIGTLTEVLEVTPDKKVTLRIPVKGGSIWSAYKSKNGNILYTENNGDVVEADSSGKRIRSVTAGGMSGWGGAQLLPNGNVLVARYASGDIVEMDWTGKELWKAVSPCPSYASRLPNGHTLATITNQNAVIEFDREGKEVWKQAAGGRPFRTWRY